MYDDFLDIEDEESFCGEHIQSFKIHVSDYSIPEELVTIQDLVSHITEILSARIADRKPSQNQLIRSFVDIFWDLKPRPNLFIVTNASSYIRYLSLSLEDARLVALHLLTFFELGDCLLGFSRSSYTSAEKIFIPKSNKLLRALFKEIEACEIMLRGSPMVCRFRESMTKYESIVSIDLESFEWSHDLLLELGIAVYNPSTNEVKAAHLLFEENSWRRNGSIVQDSRDNFSFGKSTTLPQSSILNYLKGLLRSKVCLVGHAIKNDIDMLLKASDEFSIIRYVDTYDTQQIHRQLKNKNDWDKLETLIVEYMNEAPRALHNAGNDAVYTLQVFLAMAGIEPSENVAHLEVNSCTLKNSSQNFPISKPATMEVHEQVCVVSPDSPKTAKNMASKYARSKYM